MTASVNFDPRISKSEANVLHSAAVTRDYIAQPRLGKNRDEQEEQFLVMLHLSFRL